MDEMTRGAEATAPAIWNQTPRYPTGRQKASGYDRNLKIGTGFLIASLLAFPIVLGPTAAYFGFRSHREGNIAGLVFAYASILVTIVNMAIILTVVLPAVLR